MSDYFLDQSWVIRVAQNPPWLIAGTCVRGLGLAALGEELVSRAVASYVSR